MSELNDIRYALPAVKRAIVFSPHPDDETIGCGGTMALYSDRINFTVVVLSNGEAVNIPEENKGYLRRTELLQAMQVVGVKDVIFLDLPDGRFEENRDEIDKKIAEICRQKEPEIIFVPSPIDPHPDHRETAKAVIWYSLNSPATPVAFYEVYTPIRFNTLIDIGSTLETKREALSRYHYSMLKKEDIFTSAILSLNKFRSLFTLQESSYEAFFIPDKPAIFRQLSRWMSFHSRTESPEEELLDMLRMGDTLIEELRNCEKNSSALQERILEMQELIDEKSLLLSSLEKKMTWIKKNPIWRIAKYLYRGK